MKRLALKRLRFTRTSLRPHHYHKEAVSLMLLMLPEAYTSKPHEKCYLPLSHSMFLTVSLKKKKNQKILLSISWSGQNMASF